MQLTYETTNTITGKKYGVYDQRTSGGTITQYVGPFETQEDALQYCKEFMEGYGVGYNPYSYPVTATEDNKIYAYCSRWTSCD